MNTGLLDNRKGSFTAGGSVLAVAAGARSAIATVRLRRPGLDVIATDIGISSQQQPFIGLVEIDVNGATLHSDRLLANAVAVSYPLPFVRLPSLGTLRIFVTNTSAGATTITAEIRGSYVPGR